MSNYPQAIFLRSAAAPEHWGADIGCELAFAGRSNAGKSSAINALLSRSRIARVSRTPGRTQLINFFQLDELPPGGRRLVDLPGYGFARVPETVQRHWRHHLEAYFTRRRSLVGLMLVVDVRRGLLPGDWQMLQWAQDAGRPVHILLSKADKLNRGPASAVLQATRAAVRKSPNVSVQLFSAFDGVGVDDARQVLDALLSVAVTNE